MLRLGLCCKFYKEPIKFRTTTFKYLKSLKPKKRCEELSFLCLENAYALKDALEYCFENHIGCFRINSRILPLKTHPEAKYKIEDLPHAQKIKELFSHCQNFCKKHNLRLTFHPDQFVVLNSPDKKVLHESILELEYHAELSQLLGADVINVHAGGAYGDKKKALRRLSSVVKKLKKQLRSRLTLENDDRVYTPEDLLPFCQEHGIPFVYDVQHHRCLSDNFSIEQATELALKTWDREPLFHISSLKSSSKNIGCFHSDYIEIKDFPQCWRDLNITVEVEAKAKELAIKKLQQDLKLQNS